MTVFDDIARAISGSQAQTHHFHFHRTEPDSEASARLDAIESALGLLKENLMFSFDDLKAAQAITDAKIAALKTDVEALMAKLAGATAGAQAALDAAVDHANATNTSLSTLDATINPPPTASAA